MVKGIVVVKADVEIDQVVRTVTVDTVVRFGQGSALSLLMLMNEV